MERQYEELVPKVWKPEIKGDHIEGIYIRCEEKGLENSKSYYLEKDKVETMLWGSTLLNDRMKLAHPGDYLRITFEGLKQNTRGQDVKIWKVERQIDTIDRR